MRQRRRLRPRCALYQHYGDGQEAHQKHLNGGWGRDVGQADDSSKTVLRRSQQKVDRQVAASDLL
jgi:hypothetical protein